MSSGRGTSPAVERKRPHPDRRAPLRRGPDPGAPGQGPAGPAPLFRRTPGVPPPAGPGRPRSFRRSWTRRNGCGWWTSSSASGFLWAGFKTQPRSLSRCRKANRLRPAACSTPLWISATPPFFAAGGFPSRLPSANPTHPATHLAPRLHRAGLFLGLGGVLAGTHNGSAIAGGDGAFPQIRGSGQPSEPRRQEPLGLLARTVAKQGVIARAAP